MSVVLVPGASLMDITATEAGAIIRCPGCGGWIEVRVGDDGSRPMTHEDECPVLARIEAAIAAYTRRTVRQG